MKTLPGFIKILFLAVSVVWVAFWYWDLAISGSEAVAQRGQFGDKFGALNTLFTGFAFVGLLATLWHERENSAAQEKEQRELIAALRLQAKIQTEAAMLAAWTARWSAVHREYVIDRQTDKNAVKNQYEGTAWEASVESMRRLEAMMKTSA